MDLPILYIIGLAFFLIIFGVIIALVAYVNSTKHIATPQIEQERLSDQASKEALQILDMARAKSVEIMGEANMNAQAIIENARTIDVNYKHDLKGQLQTVLDAQKKIMADSSQHMVTQWQAELEGVRTEDSQVFKSIAKNIEEQAVKEIDDFKNILIRETLSSQKVVEEKLESAYKDVEKELVTYRKEQTEKIDESVTRVLSDVAKTVIAKVIRMDEHEELILQSLDKAKKENIL